MPAEAIQVPQGDVHEPDLRIGNTLPQPADRLHLILVQLVFARLDVDGDELVLVRGSQMGPNLALDKRVAAASDLFFAVAALARGHCASPFASRRSLPETGAADKLRHSNTRITSSHLVSTRVSGFS